MLKTIARQTMPLRAKVTRRGATFAGVTFAVLFAMIGYNVVLNTRAATTPASADINKDGKVNIFDLSAVLAAWGASGTRPADVDGNGLVNIFDVSGILSNWTTAGSTPTPTATATPPPTPTPAAGGFTHPGILESRGQLDFVKAKIAAGAQPWTSAYNTTKADSHASLSLTPKPRATVQCGANDTPNLGCKDEIFDSVAAYTDALLWYYSGNAAYGKKSIQIMNAYAATLKSHTDFNAPLQTAWTAEMFTRAAEIMRYTSTDWAPADVAKYQALLTNVYLRDLTSSQAVSNFSSYNGNWDLAGIEGKMNIAVFTDNHTLFNTAVSQWKSRTKKYIYLKSDGSAPGNFGTSSPQNGQAQETCRDLQHTGMGLSSMFNAAETAYIQGTDLYGQEQTRMVAGYEHITGLIANGGYNSSLCGGSSVPSASKADTYTIGYNHFNGRKGVPMPNSKKVAESWLPNGSGTGRMFAWETLTHYDTAAARIGN